MLVYSRNINVELQTLPTPPISSLSVHTFLNALMQKMDLVLDWLWYLLDVVDPVAKFWIMDNNNGGGEDFVPEGKNLNQVIDYPRDDTKAVHVPGYWLTVSDKSTTNLFSYGKDDLCEIIIHEVQWPSNMPLDLQELQCPPLQYLKNAETFKIYAGY